MVHDPRAGHARFIFDILCRYVKKDGETVKYWECGICAKDFKHQYTLMRHLPIHTGEKNVKFEVF